MKREREPTQQEFDKLLAWLDPDRDVAAEKHETIRSGMIRAFIKGGCSESDWLADEVANRVAARIDNVVKNYDKPEKCFRGFWENVYREYLKDRARQVDIDPVLFSDHTDDPAVLKRLELEDECLARCMGELTAKDDALFRRYFQESAPAKIKIRKKLAAELGITSNALAIRIGRIRKPLHACMEACLAELKNY